MTLTSHKWYFIENNVCMVGWMIIGFHYKALLYIYSIQWEQIRMVN